MTNQQYISSCIVAGSSWCGDSIQVTSNAWWERSHGTHPRADTAPGQTTPLGKHAPTGMHSCLADVSISVNIFDITHIKSKMN